MSTSPVTPDQSSGPSTLGSIVSAGPSQVSLPAPDASNQDGSQLPQAPTAQPTSRLKAILTAVASVGSTALAGIPDRGRPSFITGLGNGARAEQADQANQQAIKFKTFDDQVRAASLHAQDVELQMRTQAQQDAHQKMQDDQQDWDEAHGIDYNPIPNSGDAAMNHLAAQTSANGAAVIPTGTHLSADGNNINVPADTQETRAGQLQKYNTFAPLYGLPSLPQGAQFVPPKLNDLLTHVQQGYGLDGHPINHDSLPAAIASLQTQRDAFASKGGTNPAQLQAVDNTIGIMKANLKALDDHAAGVVQQNAQAKKTGELAAQPQVDPDDVTTFTGTTLQGYKNISPSVVAGLKAEAQQAKTQADLDKVQTKALTMEQSGQVHADTVAATQAGKQTATQNAGLVANEKLLNDPHSGVLGALAQLNQTSASIKAGADGNALITNMTPTMEVLGINHTAGITRISPAEATAAGTSPAWATRWNAFAQKASTGKLSPELANEGNQLVGILKQGALTKLYQQQSVLSKGRGIDPSNLPSVDAQGNITTFDKVSPKQQQTIGHQVGDTITQSGRTFRVTSVDANGKVTGAQ